MRPGTAPDDALKAGGERLLARRVVSPDGCWPYPPGEKSAKGYGVIVLQSRNYAVHRLAYELWVGPIGAGLEIDHDCHNQDESCKGGDACPHRRCFNPGHLVARTHADNVKRGRSWAIQGSKTHCPQGHPYDEANTKYSVQDSGGVRRKCRACARDYMARKRARLREARTAENAA